MTHKRGHRRQSPPSSKGVAGTLRILGGDLRGRPIRYLGDPRTRPMKQRVREAVFNLIGLDVRGAQAIDLFAGTGALAWEALSRGARCAILLERHLPTARLIKENALALGLWDRTELVPGDAFVWSRRLGPSRASGSGESPWLIFCSPPYDLYATNRPEILDMLERIVQAAPASSVIVVESDDRFDPDQLPGACVWDTRHYPPAVIAIGRLPDQRVGLTPSQ
jgi:16S rRNA (guanine966-N2)-methyltransferase